MALSKKEKRLINDVFIAHGWDFLTKKCSCGVQLNNKVDAEQHLQEMMFIAGKQYAQAKCSAPTNWDR
jgi:hypothetical protein